MAVCLLDGLLEPYLFQQKDIFRVVAICSSINFRMRFILIRFDRVDWCVVNIRIIQIHFVMFVLQFVAMSVC